MLAGLETRAGFDFEQLVLPGRGLRRIGCLRFFGGGLPGRDRGFARYLSCARGGGAIHGIESMVGSARRDTRAAESVPRGTVEAIEYPRALGRLGMTGHRQKQR